MNNTPTVFRNYPETAERMRQIIIEASREPAVRNAALEITAPSRSGFYMDELRLVYEFIRNHIRYAGDPYTEDILQWPAATLESRAGDCNNRVILAGAMLRSIGFPVRMVFSFAPGPVNYATDFPEHVWLEADFTKGEEPEPVWIPIETTPLRDPISRNTCLYMKFGEVFPPRGPRDFVAVDE